MSRNNYGLIDRKYYNIAINNNELAFTPTYAIFRENFSQVLIDNPSDYYLTVVRCQIPTGDIPILIPEIQSWPNTDVNKTVYSITLDCNIAGTDYTSGEVFVIYVTNFSNPNYFPRPITIIDKDPMINPSIYYFIYDYRQFVDMVNTTFNNAYNLLNANTGGILTSGPPYITYDTTTNLMTYNFLPEYLDGSLNQIKTYFNYKLFNLFSGVEFEAFDITISKSVRIKVKDYYGTNFDGTHYLMTQQYPILSTWNVFKAIDIVSSLLPIENEVVPSPVYQNNNVLNTFSIVKDFVPFYESGYEFRTYLNFKIDGSYELINLNSNSPLNMIDITVFWVDRFGNKYILTIPYNQVLTIKFLFIRKATFTG